MNLNMNPHKQYIAALALGLAKPETPEIILKLYGPRGGLRACESISPEEAVRLSFALGKAIRAFPKRHQVSG